MKGFQVIQVVMGYSRYGEPELQTTEPVASKVCAHILPDSARVVVVGAVVTPPPVLA